MNILLITPLFPDSLADDRTKVTFAIYNFVKYWTKNHSVVVIKPKRVTWRQYRYEKIEYSSIGKIRIVKIPYFRIERLNIDFVRWMAKKIIRVLKQLYYTPDVIVSHYSFSIFFGDYISQKLSLPFVLAFHKSDMNTMHNKKSSRKYDKAISQASLVVFRSIPIQRKFFSYMPNFTGNVFVANSGIEPEIIEEKLFFDRKLKAWNCDSAIKIVTAASLKPLKCIDINLIALSKIKDVNWDYTIIGDGPEKSRLLALSDSLGISTRVHFVGQKARGEVLSVMRSSHIFIMVSYNETFGLTYLEAMAKDCIVIGAKDWGIDGIIVDGENGFLCNSGDVDELERTLRCVFALDPKEKEAILRKIYATIQCFHEEDVAQNYLNEIENVLHSEIS